MKHCFACVQGQISCGDFNFSPKTNPQLSIIEAYLPAMMPEAEVAALVDAVCAELGANSLKDMGKCMGAMQVWSSSVLASV
jgi:uncharacterized protein YqeY